MIESKICKFWRMSFDHTMSYESIFQHIKITWTNKTWNIIFQCFLYTKVLFFSNFSLWAFLQCYDTTLLFAMESQETQAFIYAKVYMTFAAYKKCFPFAPFQFVSLRIIELKKDSYQSKRLLLGISKVITLFGFEMPIFISESLESLWHLALPTSTEQILARNSR